MSAAVEALANLRAWGYTVSPEGGHAAAWPQPPR